MANDRTVERLQEAADLLCMLEEMMACGLIGQTSAAAGAKVTLRNAREAIVRSTIELRQGKASDPFSSIQTGYTTLGQSEADQGSSLDAGNEGAAQSRRRDLRASIEKVVERTP